jgi:hypothetical protein
LRHLRNPVVIFGIVIVLLCWVGACLQVFAERGEASWVAIERGDTAARLFEKDAVSLLKSIDTTMLLLRQAYEDDPKRFDLIGLARRAGMGSDVPTEISSRRGRRAIFRLRFTSEIVCIFGPRSTQRRTTSSSAPRSSSEPPGDPPFKSRAASAQPMSSSPRRRLGRPPAPKGPRAASKCLFTRSGEIGFGLFRRRGQAASTIRTNGTSANTRLTS